MVGSSRDAEGFSTEILTGRADAPTPALGWQVIRWLTGWALFVGVLRIVGGLFGYRHEMRMHVEKAQLVVSQSRYLLGQLLVKRQSRYAFESLRMVGIVTRFSRGYLYLGALCLSLGAWWGGRWMVHAARTVDGTLLILGALVLGLGVLLDFALQAAALGGRKQVGVEVYTAHAPRLRILGISEAHATAFLKELAERGIRTY